jgi:hypothetical protein
MCTSLSRVFCAFPVDKAGKETAGGVGVVPFRPTANAIVIHLAHGDCSEM